MRTGWSLEIVEGAKVLCYLVLAKPPTGPSAAAFAAFAFFFAFFAGFAAAVLDFLVFFFAGIAPLFLFPGGRQLRALVLHLTCWLSALPSRLLRRRHCSGWSKR